MAGLASPYVSFIRDVFRRGKSESSSTTRELASHASRVSAFGSSIDAQMIGDIGELLHLDKRMLFRYRDYEEMDEYSDISCLAGDSLVFVLNSGWVRIEELVRCAEPFCVLSYDNERKSIIPAECAVAKRTGERGHAKPMVRVVFDSGSSIRATDDHLFMCRDGSWKMARELEPGEGLMPVDMRFGQDSLVSDCVSRSVAVVEQIGSREAVYDLTVPRYHNFVANEVIVHNSALDIYADDATQVDGSRNRTVWVESDDEQVRKELTDMFDNRIGIDDHIWAMTRTLCLLKGTLVWTERGPVAIEALSQGDRIQAYGEGGELKFVPMKKVWRTGEKDVWKISTKHRDLIATENHPVLTKADDGGVEWKKVGDLVMRRHPCGSIDQNNTSKIVLSTTSGVSPEKVPEWVDLLGDFNWSEIGTPNEIRIGQAMTEQFARLMGFLWGDGFMGSDDLSSSSTAIVFSVGEDEEQNEFYDDCFRRLGLEPSRDEESGTSTVNSVRLKEVMLRLGWKNGASSKRLPSWLWSMPWGHRKAFLDGFIDADGWTTQQATWGRAAIHFEIANVEMGNELKALIDGLGFRSGHVRTRRRKPGFKIKGKVAKTVKETAMLTYSEYQYEPGFMSERLNSVEKWGSGEVWDVEVDDECHSFVANGIVVHNCKYGNNYEEIVVGENGVVGLNYLPVPTMRRVESPTGDLLGFLQTFSSNMDVSPEQFEKFKISSSGSTVSESKDVAAFEDWRVAQMRLTSKYRESLYGWSVIDAARWVWKRLMLLEDAVLVYKLTRSPSRYAFYIDTGKVSRPESEKILQEAMQRLKKRKFVNPRTGKIDLRANPMSMDQDFFLAVRDGKETTRVESLMGPSYQQVDDVQYFLYKLYAAIKIPRAYMGYDENMPSKATLCLAGDTRIPLLDGTEPTIAKLAGRKDPFWVHSIDEHGNSVPGLAKDARLTRHAETVEVRLDNGEVLTCTPDHPVMRRDGSYKEAGKLEPGDSLMSSCGGGISGEGKRRTIIGIRPGSIMDTYDLTVDKYHNFAVGQGIVVHNSQEDVRFARTVLRVQREVKNGLMKICKVDLAARRIDPAAVKYEIKMTVPSAIFELGQMEIRRARSELAGMMENHVSRFWLLKSVYGMSDDEIKIIDSQRKDDQKARAAAEGGTGGSTGGGGRFESVIRRPRARGHRGVLDERDLFMGDRETEKRAEDLVRRAIGDPNSALGRQLRDTGNLLREILHAVSIGKGRAI